jgi:D-galactarolactone cycloisomerase
MHRRRFVTLLTASALADPARRAKIRRIRIATVQGRFHKFVAMNAYDDTPKGYTYEHSLVRVETDQGVEGISPGTYQEMTPQGAATLKPLIGANPLELYTMDNGKIVGRNPKWAPLLQANRHLDAAFFDILGKLRRCPAWQLIGNEIRKQIPAYDGTLYFSDIWFRDRGVSAVVEECQEAVRYGFTGIKIKLGRGDKWMDRSAGDERDILVTNTVRDAIGPKVTLMADPNYGYRNQPEAAWRLLSETRHAHLYWMEEILPETVAQYSELQQRLAGAAIKTKLAAGEHMKDTSQFEPYLKPRLLMNVLQMDIRAGGFLDNARVASMANQAGAIAVPHNWASQLGMIMSLHLSKVSKAVPLVECDRSTCDVLRADWLQLRNGFFELPDGFGLGVAIDEDVYRHKYKKGEIVVD